MASAKGPARARPPRIPPLPPSERSGEIRDLLDRTRGASGPDSNIFTTLVRSPQLFRRWLGFSGRLADGVLSARDRELAILRTAANCEAEYEWGQHEQMASSCLRPDEIARVLAGPDHPGWSDWERTLLRAADELHGRYCITDATWEALATAYDDEALIEFVMLVGHYHLLAMALRTFGVELDAGLSGFPERETERSFHPDEPGD